MTSNQVTSLADMRRNGGHWFIYLFFGIHMLMFGLSGFLMAYSSDGPGLGMVYMHGGIAILVYMVFYLTIFGRDEVQWMLINAGLAVVNRAAPAFNSGQPGHFQATRRPCLSAFRVVNGLHVPPRHREAGASQSSQLTHLRPCLSHSIRIRSEYLRR